MERKVSPNLWLFIRRVLMQVSFPQAVSAMALFSNQKGIVTA